VLITAALLLASLSAAGQGISPAPKPSHKAPQVAARKLTPEQKFVFDTVNMAVALPQPDPQDRLRVLATAANVISPIDQKMAKTLWHEGVRIESELIQVGKTPAVSLMSSGQADCGAAQSFVENLSADSVGPAEQSLIGAVTSCKKQTLDVVSRKLDAALQKRIVASRALMATMEAQGTKSAWSQKHFEQMFRSLPDARENASEAENFAAMYARMSGEVENDVAQIAGLKLLDWLGKLDDTGLRTLAVNITVGAMKQALGEKGFQDALSSDLLAGSTVRNAQNGAPGQIERPAVESVSVLQAMKENRTDQSDRLRDLTASERAREAAAHGFAAGTTGDKQQAEKYFDMAFAAVDEVWDARTAETNTAAVVEEVSEAAAEVDSVNALVRAQGLHDPSAQAIAMLAVARVVAGNGIAR
jgi:ribosomal protein S20